MSAPVIRKATQADIPALKLLHRASLWGLGVLDYTLAEVDSIVRHVQTLDPALIECGRYYVAEVAGELAGSGGWSDKAPNEPIERPANCNKPTSPAAAVHIRAIFVSPKFARTGVGHALMKHVEAEARAAGSAHVDLMSTLSGVGLCERMGYVGAGRVRMPLADGTRIELVPMHKTLAATSKKRAA